LFDPLPKIQTEEDRFVIRKMLQDAKNAAYAESEERESGQVHEIERVFSRKNKAGQSRFVNLFRSEALVEAGEFVIPPKMTRRVGKYKEKQDGPEGQKDVIAVLKPVEEDLLSIMRKVFEATIVIQMGKRMVFSHAFSNSRA